MRWLVAGLAALVLAVAGCSSSTTASAPQTSTMPSGWVEDEETFTADGLTIHGNYRHRGDAPAGPAALLISESGATDRNGDYAGAGPVVNM